MAFNIKKYIIENNNRQNILTEAGVISDHDRKILQVVKLLSKIKMTQTDRERLHSILRHIRQRSSGK